MMVLATEASDARSQETIEAPSVERRRGLRIAQARPAKVFDATASRYFPAQTQDISATGLRLELPQHAPVRAGKVLNIHVGLNASGCALANRKQMMPARVVWVDRTRTRGRVTVGIEFLASIAAHLDAA